jgi:CRP-like cAMP-binding protein
MSDPQAPVTPDFQFGAVKEAEPPVDTISEEEEEEATSPMKAPPTRTARRTTVSAEVYDMASEKGFQPTAHLKVERDRFALTQVLEGHYLFKHLDDRELDQVVGYFDLRTYRPGDTICAEGESPEHSLFHVVLEGKCIVQRQGAVVRLLEARCTIGDTDMMYGLPRADAVVALTAVRAFAIDRRTYQRTLHSTFADKRAMYCEFLKNVKFLEGLSQPEMVQLADCLEPCKFAAGEPLIRHAAPPDYMYVIVEGDVRVVGRDESGATVDVCRFSRGAIVGELEFLYDHNNVADVIAASDEVRAARLERNHFELCMGSLKDLLKSSRKLDPVYEYYNRKRSLAPHPEGSPTDPGARELRAQLEATEKELASCRQERLNLEMALHEANRSCLRIEAEALLKIRALEQELDRRNQQLAQLRPLPQLAAVSPSTAATDPFRHGSSPSVAAGASPTAWGSPQPAGGGIARVSSTNSSSAGGGSLAHACRLPGCRLCLSQTSGRPSI